VLTVFKREEAFLERVSCGAHRLESEAGLYFFIRAAEAVPIGFSFVMHCRDGMINFKFVTIDVRNTTELCCLRH
jgi:hypothetical protein